MADAITYVRSLVHNARVDCCPYEEGEDGTGYFIRIGMYGHWLSKVRKHPRAAWANAAQRLRRKPAGTNGASEGESFQS